MEEKSNLYVGYDNISKTDVLFAIVFDKPREIIGFHMPNQLLSINISEEEKQNFIHPVINLLSNIKVN